MYGNSWNFLERSVYFNTQVLAFSVIPSKSSDSTRVKSIKIEQQSEIFSLIGINIWIFKYSGV